MKSPIKFLKYLCLLLLTGCATSETETYQWTRFRGSDGRGIDSLTSAPVSWDSSGFLWNTILPGEGISSPVVWGNKIFVTSADDSIDLGYVVALDDSDGQILWQKEFTVTDLKLHEHNRLAAATPAVDKSQVYIVWYSIEKTSLIALSHDGILQWEAEFDGIEANRGGGSSLMLTDKYVVFTREPEETSSIKASWVAVNKRTGETVWELERESPRNNSFSTPLLMKKGKKEDQIIFASMSHGLTGVDPKTGQVLWERKEMFSARVVTSHFYAGGMIIAAWNGETKVIDFDPISNQAADSARYSLPRNISSYVPTPIAVGEFLYLCNNNGTVSCVRLATGELIWKEKPAGQIYGSPICVGGNLYIVTHPGEVLVIRADSTYQLLGISELGEGSFSTPAMCRTGMVFRTFSRVMVLGKDK